MRRVRGYEIKPEADLQDADLQDADLQDADLWDADLWEADLRGACLRDADLWEADLRGACLRDADLQGADLGFADLQCADLQCADLRGADLSKANLRGANLQGANLQGADLRGVGLRGIKLSDTTILSTGQTWPEYLADLPALLTAGGKPLAAVATEAAWSCHDDNCPMHVAFDAKGVGDVPEPWRSQAKLFVALFDAELIPLEAVRATSMSGAE